MMNDVQHSTVDMPPAMLHHPRTDPQPYDAVLGQVIVGDFARKWYAGLGSHAHAD